MGLQSQSEIDNFNYVTNKHFQILKSLIHKFEKKPFIFKHCSGQRGWWNPFGHSKYWVKLSFSEGFEYILGQIKL